MSEVIDKVKGVGFIPDDSETLKGSRRLRQVAVFLGGIAAGLAVVLFVVVEMYRPTYNFYAMLEDEQRNVTGGNIFAYEAPFLTHEAVANWAGRAVTEIMTMGFHDYEQRIYAVQPYFTDDYFVKYIESLLLAGVIDEITEKRQIHNAYVVDKPVVISEGLDILGNYYWRVQIPIGIGVTFGSESSYVSRLVTVKIRAMDKSERSSAIAISEWSSIRY